MGPRNKPATFNNSDLKSSLSSIARRQNVLAAVPPAVRALPLFAFAAGDFFQRRSGEKQQGEWLFGPADGGGTGDVGIGSLGHGIEIGIGVGALGSGSTAVWLAPGKSASTVPSSCGVCLRKGLAGFAFANVHGPVDHADVGRRWWNGAYRVLCHGLRRRGVSGTWTGTTQVPL